ncbi:unnamed protein product [Staurois parvus]|uniref:Uncharacterized protein n=1 Tax=Staurois parvus TaxID=386267 RepID=A0ABN9HQT4_9NEOB|nr:unnamed protein product [Staurois parvus]
MPTNGFVSEYPPDRWLVGVRGDLGRDLKTTEPTNSMTAGLSVETRPLDDTGSTGLWLRTSAASTPSSAATSAHCHLKHGLSDTSSACCLTYSLINDSVSSKITILCPSITILCLSLSNNSVSLSNSSVSLE